jgi:hypothetical protein
MRSSSAGTQLTAGDGGDAFVVKFGPAGNLLFSTRIGGRDLGCGLRHRGGYFRRGLPGWRHAYLFQPPVENELKILETESKITKTQQDTMMQVIRNMR